MKSGAIVYQEHEGRGIGILNRIRAYALQYEGATVWFDLGLCKVKVISNNPGKLQALQDAGLEIVERVSIEVESSAPAEKYLRTKKEKMGHLLELKAS